MISRRAVFGAAMASAGLGGVVIAQPADARFTLTHPDGRQTAYRAMSPARAGRWPVVLFSHGANSSHFDYDRLWRPWAERGYLVIGANHIDSGPAAGQRKVGRSELWKSRIADTALPLSQRKPFEAFAAARDGKPDWRALCAAGHSYGAVVAQALSGAKLLDPGDQTRVDAKIPDVRTCLAFSPPGPLPKFIPADAWSTVTAPSLLQTGDADVLPGFVDDWRSRLTGFTQGPERWTIVARGVNHYFGGLICRRAPDAGANLPALEETAHLSCDILDAYVRGRGAARAALEARAAQGDDGVLTFCAA